MNVTVLDYGIGNLLNVCRALEACGASVSVVDHAAPELARADRIVLPGVGAFGDAMAEMRARGLDEAVLRHVASGRPFLGICVGMQLLFEWGEEMGLHRGLGLLAGRVLAVPAVGADGRAHRIPHIGWKKLVGCANWAGTVLQDAAPEDRFYFVHSFAPVPDDATTRLADTDYDGVAICAVVGRGNLWGCQFHPERSAGPGLRLLKRFLMQ